MSVTLLAQTGSTLSGATARELWLVIAALVAIIVGLVTGQLSWIDNRRVAAAILRGGAAFGATMLLTLMIYSYL